MRDRVKRRVARHCEWKSGALKEVLGVRDSRELRHQHLEDFLTLFPEQRILAEFPSVSWDRHSASDRRKIDARLRLADPEYPF
jgi:hypothetical protein